MPDEKHPDTAAAGTGNADYAAALSGLAVVESGLASVRERLTALAAVRPSRPAEPVMPGGIAEVIHGEAEQQHMIEQLQREARKEVLTFVRPPYVSAAGNIVQKERLTAGVEYRSLYETTALVYPGAADMPGFVEPGELARAAPSVPMKLMIVDAERALLPLSGGRDRSVVSSAGLLLLHPSVLVDALLELFEDRWLRGTPLRMPSLGGEAEEDPEFPGSPELDEQLLSLLMSGLPDKAIASQLGISLRTLQRRIRSLMESTGTANRTQLAWFVAQQRLT
ncbi:helix-turn-helix transcriptional regulator [Actinacidiphila glaucinigra]|uniref:Regulatory protein, luxR family n=1 Tax=Actinacidiphila glaucinigra TaxID=235986 RepID=A0A239AQ54_9ACTN|nr:LuxR C-terminal-related transcriptional regulator [Actinacidiphila glaucinigra]SNR97118.1 regulatory protein, luxR family [Actinacidiphila glaucinigra]